MDLSSINMVALLASVMVASTPILLAAIGELVVEKAGVLNLGVEGMMITGAIFGFAVSVETGSTLFGFVAGAVGGALLSLIFAVLTQVLLSNQVATGLALTMFGLGFSALVGHSYTGKIPPSTPKLDVQALTDIPYVGPVLLNHDYMVYVSLLMVFLVWYFLRFIRKGLVLRSVGENHAAAHSLGYKVVRIRILAIMFGGAMAGLGGAYYSLIRVPLWTEGMTAGAGWIALALVVFASWRPWRVILGAYLFGGVMILQLNLQAEDVDIPVAYLSMTPYLMTILVLVILSGAKAPASLGRVFHASH